MKQPVRSMEEHAALVAERMFKGAPKPWQMQALKALESERRILLIQPTGSGKSFTFTVAAHSVKATQRRFTVVVSPLLALSGTLTAAMQRSGLKVAKWDSNAERDLWNLPGAVKAGLYDVIVVSPERFFNPAFKSAWKDIKDQVGLFVLDEAHLVASWGSSLRPEFVKIGKIVSELPDAMVLACSATVDDSTAAAICRVTGELHVIRGDLSRPHVKLLRMASLPFENHVSALPAFLRIFPGPAIVYTTTTRQADQIARALAPTYAVKVHHGKLDKEQRERAELALTHGTVDVMVATSSLGMGVDFPKVKVVFLLGLPPNMTEVMQRSGHAGRQGRHGVCMMLPLDNPEQDWWALQHYVYEPEMEALVRKRVVDNVSKAHLVGRSIVNPHGTADIDAILARADSLGLIHLTPQRVKLLESDWSVMAEVGAAERLRYEQGRRDALELATTDE